jgi:hypothetical protein
MVGDPEEDLTTPGWGVWWDLVRLGELSNRDECRDCCGSGEGRADGSRCRSCGGSGEVVRFREEEDC